MRIAFLGALWLALAGPAAAQPGPFVFTTTTTSDQTRPALRFDYDIGIAERAFQSDVANQPEERVGVQASRGRLTLLARFGMTDAGSAYQSTQSAEALFSVLKGGKGIDLAAGGGVLHEASGVDVLLAHIVAGRNTSASHLYGNLVFEKPLAAAAPRDSVDLITSVGWARNVSRNTSLGVEAVGEDLEGFWNPHEAEGGARLLAGPSLHVTSVGGRWRLTATGGPEFHSTLSGVSSTALRDLPSGVRRSNFAVRVGLSVSLSSMQ